ncbi:sensor histidine kinase [Kitasatospora aureofaciens]|uniref:sensor histidine kinase n=1 Tax=Kitasatospora aureofaciens TaxID=1894 RepID=UPI0037C99710
MTGKLRVFLGAAPGVGKTYAMLREGRRLRAEGLDVVVGLVETYGRRGTEEQLGDLPVLPRRPVSYRGTELTELDVDALLARRPALALVDELAHTNVPGGRHAKRWQDVRELLDAGIDVATTLNIQHLESLNDVVEQITGVAQRETIPDEVVRAAERIELVDLSPQALRARMAQGEIYAPDRIDVALDHYFRAGNLGALRELALLWLADRVEEELADYRARHGIRAPWETKERIMVALNGAPQGEHLIRRGARTAARVHGDLIGVHVRLDDGTAQREPPGLAAQRALLRELHGSYVEVSGGDPARALVDFARSESATQILLGPTSRSRLRELVSGSVINRVIRLAGPIDVRVLPPPEPGLLTVPPAPRRRRPALVPVRRRRMAWLFGPVGVAALAWALSPLRGSLGLSGVLLCLLLVVAGTARLGGLLPAAGSTAAGALAADYFYTTPWHSLTVDRGADVAALLVFLAVAGVISHLIDGLTRRSQQAGRARAEAAVLTRLAGETVESGPRVLPDLVAELRQVFGLDAAAVLVRTGAIWQPAASAGAEVPLRPDEASFSVDLGDDAVLVLRGAPLNEEDARLLGPYVTQLKLARERERLAAQASAAEVLAHTDALHTALLEAVGQDLRAPLAAVRQEAERMPGPGGQRVGAEVERMERLVANLLDLSRLRAGVMPVVLRPTVVAEVVRSAAEGAPGVRVDLEPGLPRVLADAGLLERVFADVLAWGAAGSGAVVDAGVVAGRVDVRMAVRMAVREDPAREPAGLAVVRGFVEAMNGELTVEEAPGGGTAYVISLARAVA